MLLNEPPRSQGDLNFMLLGIPIRIHWMFWLMALFLGYNSRGPKELLVWVAALLVSILVHELGHAAVMRLYGLQPSITLYGMGGLTPITGPNHSASGRCSGHWSRFRFPWPDRWPASCWPGPSAAESC